LGSRKLLSTTINIPSPVDIGEPLYGFLGLRDGYLFLFKTVIGELGKKGKKIRSLIFTIVKSCIHVLSKSNTVRSILEVALLKQ